MDQGEKLKQLLQQREMLERTIDSYESEIKHIQTSMIFEENTPGRIVDTYAGVLSGQGRLRLRPGQG